MNTGFKHVYGPVPSRRLGRSLGVDAPAAKPPDTAVLERTLRSLLARDFRTKESYQEIQIAPMRQRPHGGRDCRKT